MQEVGQTNLERCDKVKQSDSVLIATETMTCSASPHQMRLLWVYKDFPISSINKKGSAFAVRAPSFTLLLVRFHKVNANSTTTVSNVVVAVASAFRPPWR